MVEGRRTAGVAVILFGVTAAACGSGGSATSTPHVTRGGTLVIGASGEPGCATWGEPCVGSVWGIYMMQAPTLPSAYVFSEGQYHTTSLLAGEPTLNTGPPQQVTYRINPHATWSDGRPITSADFKYTHQELAQDESEIRSVDDSDPRIAVVTFAFPFAPWREEFDVLFPARLLDGKDRDAIMHDGYTFSGGPWIIDHWTRGQEVKLVRNPRYWGAQPHFDTVVFKVLPDTFSYMAAFQSGQIDVAYVTGASTETQALRSVRHSHYDVTLGLSWSSLLFNTQRPPLDSLAVRQALAYATDRSAIVTQLLGSFVPGIAPDQDFLSPANRFWYSGPFGRYTYSSAMATRLMSLNGWSRGSDGVWTKGGERAALALSGSAGNHGVELEEQIIQSQWKQAAFDVTIDNSPQPVLFGDRLPKGTFQVSLAGLATGSTDPGLCFRFCSGFIPTQANGYQGGNIMRTSDGELDRLWQAQRGEVDTAKRLALVHQAEQRVADLVPVLPINGQPQVLAYDEAKVGGPVHNDPSGPFTNLTAWYCVSLKC